MPGHGSPFVGRGHFYKQRAVDCSRIDWAREAIQRGVEGGNTELGAGRSRANRLPNPGPLAEEEPEAQGGRGSAQGHGFLGRSQVQGDTPV